MSNLKVLTEYSNELNAIYLSWGYSGQLIEYMDHILNEELGGCLDAYKRLLTDWQVQSAVQQRIRAVVSKSWVVEPGGPSALDKAASDFIEENLNNINFDDITEKHLYGLWYGFSVAEVLYGVKDNKTVIDDIKVRDRRYFRFDRNRKLRFMTFNAPAEGILMPDRKFWYFTFGGDSHLSPYGKGLAHYCYWPSVFLRNAVKSGLIYLEKFAQPTPVIRLPAGKANDPTERGIAMAILEGIQQDSGIVVPENLDLSLLEAGRAGVGEYTKFAKMMEQAITKIILSQTMTTDDGSSLAQAQVHQDVADDVVTADSDLICRSFNAGPVKWLTEFNFPGAAIPNVWRETEPPEDLDKRADRDTKVYSLGYKPTPDLIKQVYGVGWEPRDMNPPAPEPMELDNTQEFSEIDNNKLNRLLAAARANQDDIDKTSGLVADVVTKSIAMRITKLLAVLEETGDLVEFRESLVGMMENPGVDDDVVGVIERLILASRLEGMVRGQGNG